MQAIQDGLRIAELQRTILVIGAAPIAFTEAQALILFYRKATRLQWTERVGAKLLGVFQIVRKGASSNRDTATCRVLTGDFHCRL